MFIIQVMINQVKTYLRTKPAEHGAVDPHFVTKEEILSGIEPDVFETKRAAMECCRGQRSMTRTMYSTFDSTYKCEILQFENVDKLPDSKRTVAARAKLAKRLGY
jgi:hypothetical protein